MTRIEIIRTDDGSILLITSDNVQEFEDWRGDGIPYDLEKALNYALGYRETIGDLNDE